MHPLKPRVQLVGAVAVYAMLPFRQMFAVAPSTSSPLAASVVGSWSKRGCLLPMIHVVNVPLPVDDAMLHTSACVAGS